MSEEASNLTNELRKLVATGKSEKALNQMIEIFKQMDENDLENQAISTLARLNNLNRDKMAGVITSSNASISGNQINAAILYLVSKLENLDEGDLENEHEIENKTNEEVTNKIVELDLSNILEEERNHLTTRFTSLREKRNFFQVKLDKESNPSQIFSLKKDIEEIQSEMDEIFEKLKKLS